MWQSIRQLCFSFLALASSIQADDALLKEHCKEYIIRKYPHASVDVVAHSPYSSSCHSRSQELDDLLAIIFKEDLAGLTHHPFNLVDTGICPSIKVAIQPSSPGTEDLLVHTPCNSTVSLCSLASILEKNSFPLGYIVYPTESKDEEIAIIKVLTEKKVKIFKEDIDIEGLELSRIFWTTKRHCLHEPGIAKKKSIHSITYTIPASRLGDKLLSFLHASWIAYKYQIPLHLKPFRSSSSFHLTYNGSDKAPKTRNIIVISKESDIMPHKKTPTLFEVPFFASNKEILHEKIIYPMFDVDWEDTTFKSIIKRSLAQHRKRGLLNKDPSTIAIGIHIRTGAGKDSESVRRGWKLKFPPIEYFAKQIITIQRLLEGKKLQYFLFTDDKEPQALARALNALLNGKEVLFQCRDSTANPKETILSDFALLQEMDALIISQSSFSFVAAKTGCASIIIMPINSTNKEGIDTIDKIKLSIDGSRL